MMNMESVAPEGVPFLARHRFKLAGLLAVLAALVALVVAMALGLRPSGEYDENFQAF